MSSTPAAFRIGITVATIVMYTADAVSPVPSTSAINADTTISSHSLPAAMPITICDTWNDRPVAKMAPMMIPAHAQVADRLVVARAVASIDSASRAGEMRVCGRMKDTRIVPRLVTSATSTIE